MEIYNTLTRKKDPFEPRENNKVQMFVCGPTVYDYIHIGNARTFVFFDVVAKYLRHKGYDVNYIQNITDIDNKIIERAEKEGIDPLEYAKKYTEIFKEDMRALGVTSSEYKNATDHIPEVIKQVQTLLDKDRAYVIDGDGIYFDLSTFSDYGKLSGRVASMADDAISRIDDSDKKRNKGDFAIWKFKQHNDPSWPAPFGEGRPGWHIEDTAITEKYFGPQYDIHGGGQDLIFPHHEAEIAQQESASGLKPFVKYWMHSGFLVNKDAKMSKSAGNFETVNELLKKYPKEVLRFYLLSNHYRSPLQYSEEILKQSQAAVQRIGEFVDKILSIQKENILPESVEGGIENFINSKKKSLTTALDDDFNTPRTIAEIFNFMRAINSIPNLDKNTAKKILKLMEEFDSVLGVITTRQEKTPNEIMELLLKRDELRKNEKWNEADKIRTQIQDLGWNIEDTVYGPLVTKTNDD